MAALLSTVLGLSNPEKRNPMPLFHIAATSGKISPLTEPHLS